MKKTILLYVLLLFVYGCTKDAPAGNNYMGTIINGNGEKLAYSEIEIIQFENSLLNPDEIISEIETDAAGNYTATLLTEGREWYNIRPKEEGVYFFLTEEDSGSLLMPKGIGAILGKPIEAKNEWNVYYCRKSPVNFRIKNVSNNNRKCEFFLAPDDVLTSGTGIERIAVNNVDTTFQKMICKINGLYNITWQVKDQNDNLVYEESASFDISQRGESDIVIEY